MTWLMKILQIYLEEKKADKIFHDKAYNISKNSKYDGYKQWFGTSLLKDHFLLQKICL